MPIKVITLQFARGLIIQSHDEEENWFEFAINKQTYRDSLRQTKVQNLKGKSSKDASHIKV